MLWQRHEPEMYAGASSLVKEFEDLVGGAVDEAIGMAWGFVGGDAAQRL
jgi:hypothetical protein